MTKLEFYLGNADKHLTVLDAESVPRSGEYVNIRKRTFRVVRVTWAVDHADDWSQAKLRANIELEAVNE